MSRILHVYFIDLPELGAVIGSHDEILLNRILSSGLARTMKGQQSEVALRAIFAGGPFESDLAEHYIDALQLICANIAADSGDVQFRFGDPYLPEALEDLATNMMGEDPFPSVPGLAASFNAAERNGWGYLSKESCAEELEEWAGHVPDGPDDLDGYLIDWLRESKTAGKDIIGFWGG